MARLDMARKAKKLREYLNQYGKIYVVIDARHEGVDVPEYLRDDLGLRLVFNTRMPQPLRLSAESIEVRLSFAGQAYDCVIPMLAIWGVHSADGDFQYMWEADIPDELKADLQVEPEVVAKPSPKAVKGQHLRMVP